MRACARNRGRPSSEFTLRILDLVEADPRAVSALAALFREARFSEHEVTEDDRQPAIDRARPDPRALLAATRVEVES